MSEHTDIALETRRLGKRYGRKWALSECSLTLPKGRMAALVGPNGAGKTTLLSLAVGLLQPNAGAVSVWGRDPWREPLATLPRVGFVAQDHPLYRGFTVADTLAYGRHMNQQWDGALVESRLRRLSIPLEQRVGKLSGGQQAQVALAMALGKRPDLLLLDEPVASLDPLARRDFLRMLVEAATERGITTLLSSHIIGDLEQSCDYLIILSASRVQLADEISAITRSHRLLSGPRGDAPGLASLRARWDVVSESQNLRQTILLARAAEDTPTSLPAGWSNEAAPLEEIVLAYLSQPLGDDARPDAVAAGQTALEATR